MADLPLHEPLTEESRCSGGGASTHPTPSFLGVPKRAVTCALGSPFSSRQPRWHRAAASACVLHRCLPSQRTCGLAGPGAPSGDWFPP